MRKKYFQICFVSIVATAFITGCKTAPTSATNSAAAHDPAAVAQLALNEGIALYDNGNYNGALKRLTGANEIWNAGKPVQIEALKYMAFSYCVTGRQALCRQQFEKALKLNPAFDLAPGEKGHPLWGPVFVQAKKSK
jgi:Flp pilus assembly protein TadD